MTIHCNFPGGNIEIAGIYRDRVWVRPELRDTAGDWFYWAFCAEGAAGRTLSFDFCHDRLGYFGPAISHDLESWSFAGAHTLAEDRRSFSYTFQKGENRVYFAHNLLYQPKRFTDFCSRIGLPIRAYARTRGGNDALMAEFGEGEKTVVLTARHHACECSGSYVLEGVCEYLYSNLPKAYRTAVVPFTDMDGVLRGDQGKNRIPHDHNRDYTDEPIYTEVDALMRYARERRVCYAFDFHSPWHVGGRNDSVFLVRNRHNPRGQDLFSRCLSDASKGLSFTYDASADIAPGTDWNFAESPTGSRYFSLLPEAVLSLTLETPYFGTADNRAEQQSMVRFGHAFGKALCTMIERNDIR